MAKTYNFPTVGKKNKVVFRQEGCKEAILVQVHEGTHQLRFESSGDSSHRVMLGDKSLFDVDGTYSCPTCGCMISRGYAERDISMKKALETSKRINDSYKGIKEAVDRVAPILGLLEEGYYILADWEMNPFQSGKHFWNDGNIFAEFVPYALISPKSGKGYRCGNKFGPNRLIPTERPNMCNRDRVQHYIERLDEGEAFPRAIGCHIGGGNVLLLDGHHKAAAQAVKGHPVRCLVIIPVIQLDGSPVEELARKPYFYKPQPYVGGAGALLDKAHNCVGIHKGFFEIPRAQYEAEWNHGDATASYEDWIWGSLPDDLSSDSEWKKLSKEREARALERKEKKQAEREKKSLHLYHTPFVDIAKLLDE